ncbi:MAG: hypothetical protein AUI16_20980 [Alphaproteobacteria bacterium 13_2_20CM_2_64_7]|nr:MAG: hypothetical protein AUI16_20980 [Alphaproteobacteria bacterium 13_2_20CM_2_64_7]
MAVEPPSCFGLLLVGFDGARWLKQVITGPSRHKGPPQMRRPFAREDQPAIIHAKRLVVEIRRLASQADIQMTKAIADVATPFGIFPCTTTSSSARTVTQV